MVNKDGKIIAPKRSKTMIKKGGGEKTESMTWNAPQCCVILSSLVIFSPSVSNSFLILCLFFYIHIYIYIPSLFPHPVEIQTSFVCILWLCLPVYLPFPLSYFPSSVKRLRIICWRHRLRYLASWWEFLPQSPSQ